MEIALLIITGLAIALAAFAFFKLLDKKPEAPDNQGMLLLQNRIEALTQAMDAKLGESTKVVHGDLLESRKIIQEITRELTRVGQSQKEIAGVGEQLRSLQDILKNPKQRGVLGEYYLETVLKNVLPPDVYKLQYPFSNGEIVDAVIFTKHNLKEGIIPIDSKFSLENYNRILEAQTKEDRERYETAFANDLKIRIDETSKYIRPQEGTLDFAFMFIPSEGVYYDLLINKVGVIKSSTENLIEYANKKKVMVVSPTTFFAYLQTVMQGLRALKIEESAKEIQGQVYQLGKHLSAYDTYMNKLGDNLGTTVNAFNKAHKELGKIDKDVYKISGEKMGIEPLALEKPETEEIEE
ncbi:MAG: DNA recombination protein RmuC [Candidatus Liptonbacteria bacterium]|nr:DNA recombination protein RmuC [Candidatus Liptonbacteria bacterium]